MMDGIWKKFRSSPDLADSALEKTLCDSCLGERVSGERREGREGGL